VKVISGKENELPSQVDMSLTRQVKVRGNKQILKLWQVRVQSSDWRGSREEDFLMAWVAYSAEVERRSIEMLGYSHAHSVQKKFI